MDDKIQKKKNNWIRWEEEKCEQLKKINDNRMQVGKEAVDENKYCRDWVNDEQT